jgi:hypothetical protein
MENNILNLKEKTSKKRSIKEIWSDFKEYAKTPEGKKRIIAAILILLLVLGVIYTVYLRYYKKEKVVNNATTVLPKVASPVATEPKKIVSYLDGQKYTEDTANRHPLAIMIENHPDARPQSGLDKAKVIYEAVTEGGITRFMAIYGPEGASKVGPVRSARTYFVDYDVEYDGFYAHVGGNLDALELINQLGVKDLDQFRYGSEAYWREPDAYKATEHTMYTDTEKLWNIAKNNGWDMKATFDSLPFKEEANKDQRPESQSVTINFSSSGYLVNWQYDKGCNCYLRNMAGEQHKDAQSGEQLKSKNIVIQELERWYAPTSINEEGWAMQTVGEGNVKVIIDGKTIEGKWKKDNIHSRTQFYDSNGNQIKFDPGVTWYEIISNGTPVTIE